MADEKTLTAARLEEIRKQAEAAEKAGRSWLHAEDCARTDDCDNIPEGEKCSHHDGPDCPACTCGLHYTVALGHDVPALLAALEAAREDIASLSDDIRKCDAILDAALGEGSPDDMALEVLHERLPRLVAKLEDETALRKRADVLQCALNDANRDLASACLAAQRLRDERDILQARLARLHTNIDAAGDTGIAQLREMETPRSRVAELEGALAKERELARTDAPARAGVPWSASAELAAAPPEQAPRTDDGARPAALRILDAYDIRRAGDFLDRQAREWQQKDPERTPHFAFNRIAHFLWEMVEHPANVASQPDDATPPADTVLRVAQGLLRTYREHGGADSILAPPIAEAIVTLERVVEDAADVGTDVRTCDTCRHHRPNAARRCAAGCGWAPLDVGAAPPTPTYVVTDYFRDRDYRPYRNCLHDPATDAALGQNEVITQAIDASGAKDGDEIVIVATKTGRRPFGDRRFVYVRPHTYERESEAPPVSAGTAGTAPAHTPIRPFAPRASEPRCACGYVLGCGAPELHRPDCPELARLANTAMEGARLLAQAGDPLCDRCGERWSLHMKPGCPCPSFVASGAEQPTEK